VHFLARDRAMLHALRHDEHLAGRKRHCAIAQFDIEHTFEDQKEIIGVVVLVPDEFTLELRDHHVVAVVGRHGARREVVAEGCELFRKVDLGGHRGLRLRLVGLA
jgi:hypothetical protein